MHDGDSDRRSRGRRGGKREFGGPQDFGSDFGGSEFGGDFYGGGRDGGYRGGRDNDFGGGYGRDDNKEGGYGGGRGGYGGGGGRGGYGGGGDREGGGGYGGGGGRGGYGGGGRGGYGGGPREGGEGDGFRQQRPRRDMPPVERGPRQSGTVKFFKNDKGFGFITPDEGDADVFVHISAVERSGFAGLDSGQRVSFETEPDRRGKGPKAVNLQALEEGDAPQEDDGGPAEE
jgi:CspA family cold shock protein